MSTQDAQEEFEQYLFEMDDVLEVFRRDVAARCGVLDGTRGSLWLLERFLDGPRDASAEQELMINRAARYLGEVFRLSVGGVWALDSANEMSLHYGLPVLTAYSSTGIIFCPSAIVRNYLHARRAGLLEEAIQSHAEHADLV